MKHALLPHAFQEASVVSLRHRYVLIVNSKTAGTTLRSVAAAMEREPLALWDRGASRDEPAQRIENWIRTPTLAEVSKKVLSDIFFGREFFRFTTVRHPFSRCWSAWIDKVVGRHPEFVESFGSQSWFPPVTVRAEQLVSYFQIFVDVLARGPGLIGADRHWAPQANVIQYGLFPYDLVGKTEAMNEVVDAWSDATGLRADAILESVGKRNVRSLPLPVDQLSLRTWEQLTDLYRTDLISFSYSPDRDSFGLMAEDWVSRAHALLEDIYQSTTSTTLAQRFSLPLWRHARSGSARAARQFAGNRSTPSH